MAIVTADVFPLRPMRIDFEVDGIVTFAVDTAEANDETAAGDWNTLSPVPFKARLVSVGL